MTDQASNHQPTICSPHGVPFHKPSRDCIHCEVQRLSAEAEGWKEKYFRVLEQRAKLKTALDEIAHQTNGIYENWKGVDAVHRVAHEALRPAVGKSDGR